MNVHELTMDGSPETAECPVSGSARQRTSTERQEFESSEKLHNKRPTGSPVVKPSLECREGNVLGLSALGRDFADISPRTPACEDEFDEICLVEPSLKSSLKVFHTRALRNQNIFPVGSALDEDCADNSPQTSASEDEFDDTCDSMRDLFKKSYEYIKPGPFFRFAVNFYAERKLLVFFWIHFVLTMIIWGKSSQDSVDQLTMGANVHSNSIFVLRISQPILV
jgi:hypothetical protein